MLKLTHGLLCKEECLLQFSEEKLQFLPLPRGELMRHLKMISRNHSDRLRNSCYSEHDVLEKSAFDSFLKFKVIRPFLQEAKKRLKCSLHSIDFLPRVYM